MQNSNTHHLSSLQLQMNNKGNVIQSVSNLIIAILNPIYCQQSHILKGNFFFDNFTNEIKYDGFLIHDEKEEKSRIWNDRLNNILGLEIELHFQLYYQSNKLWEAIKFVASLRSINPPKEYLNQLTWNGDKEAINKLLPRYLGAEDSELNRWIMQHVLIGMVSRVFNKGCKFDEILVLVGGQGIGKSTFVEKLAMNKSWYSSINSIEGKEASINLIGKTIIEIEEFVAFKRARNVNEIKAFLSKSVDRIRLPYDRVSQDLQRSCIFIATLNDKAFLNDSTGERRFLPIECDKDKIQRNLYYQENNKERLNQSSYYKQINEDFEQAFALAAFLYKNNQFNQKLPSHLLVELEKIRMKYKTMSAEVEDIQFFLNQEKLNTVQPHITCFKELQMAGYTIKAHVFRRIMSEHFTKWRFIRLAKSIRIKPNGVSITVKAYYEKQK